MLPRMFSRVRKLNILIVRNKKLYKCHQIRHTTTIPRHVPLTPQQKDLKQLQPVGVQTLLNDSNLHETYKRYITRSTYSATLEPMENAWTMFPEIYVDPAFAKMEKEKVFKKSWTAIDHKSDHLQNHGDVLSTYIGDIPILITNDNGELKGFYNVCRHRGSILLKQGKYTKCNIIRCPYHSWTYSCGGKLAGTPFFNDDKMPENKEQRQNPDSKNEMFDYQKINFNKDEYGLFEFGVKECLGTLFVNLNTNKEERDSLWKYQFGDLEENYGHYPWDDMRTIKSFEYDINANWKLVAENFIEYYHLPWVHPELCEVSSVANHLRRQGRGQYIGLCTYPLTYGGTPADPDAFIPFAGTNPVDQEAAWFIQIFPNIAYFIYPHHVVSLITYPNLSENCGKTKEKMTFIMDKKYKEIYDNPKDDDEKKIKADIDELAGFYVLVNAQDIGAVENLQTGLENATDVYRGGRLSGKFEEPIYRYQNILIDYMTDKEMRDYPGDDDFCKSEEMKKE